MRHFIGIDVGTSSTKTTLMDETGAVVATASQCYPCDHPHSGWSEQDPTLWYDAAVSTVRAVVSESGIVPGDVEGLSFGGQMHGLVVLDSKDKVIRPAILWNDGRSAGECEFLNDKIGRDVLTERCGNIAFPGFTAPKLLWMKSHEPERFASIAKIMLPKDYLAYRLTGAFCTDVSDASGTLFFDVRHRSWSDPMLEVLGVARDQVPAVHESWEVVGTLTAAAARDMGLPVSVRVAAGAGDNAAAAVGMGCVHEGQCNISLGTSGTVFLPTRSMHVDAANTLHSFADASGAYHLMGCMLSAASANGWWVKRILDSDFPDELSKIGELGRNRVMFLPYLMGERSPINDANARAAFIGMDIDTTRTDMVQAVLEGVTFALRQSFDAATAMGVDADRFTICGGGAQNPVWKRMVADVFGRPLSVIGADGGPGFGACLLAMVGCGAYPSIVDAAEAVVPRPSERIEPDAGASARYEERYRAFCAVYPALKDVFPVVLGCVR